MNRSLEPWTSAHIAPFPDASVSRIPFARNIIDSFLMFGFCVVSIEDESPPPFAGLRRLRKEAVRTAERARQPEKRKRGNAEERGSAYDARKKGAEQTQSGPDIVANGVHNVTQRERLVDVRDETVNLVPIVPDINTYSLTWRRKGETGYSREYRIFSTTSRNVYRVDDVAEVFFREEPDFSGNVCSPISTVFQTASFISALEELALQAEVVRARQLLVTQPQPRGQNNGALDPANLFFDSESRAVQSAAAAEDDAAAAESLTLSVKLCNLLNRMQTTDSSGRPVEGTSRSAHVPPEVPPRLFAVPERQSVVPNLRPPEARSDLVDLIRVCNDHIAASLGVPASVIFEGALLQPQPSLAAIWRLRNCALRAQASSRRIACHSRLRDSNPTNWCASSSHGVFSLAGCSCSTPQSRRSRSARTRCSPRRTTPATTTPPPATSSCCSPRRSRRRPRSRVCLRMD